MSKNLLFTFLVTGASFLFSCTGTIKDISFQTGDYLGTGYDESDTKKTSLKSLAVATSQSVDEEDMPDIYEKSVNLTFEEVDMLLRTELENSNFRIVYVSHVSKAAKEGQDMKDFWNNMNLYLVCKLSECTKILKHNPQLLSQFPIRIYTYEKDGKIVIGTFKPSTAIKYMGNPDAQAIKALKVLDMEIKKVIDSVSK